MPDTQVTGTITDPNGLPYSFAQVNVILMPGGAGPSKCSGNPLQTVAPFRCDENGSFALMLCPNASITPGGSQWEFNVSINPGVPNPIGFGPMGFNLAVTIAGGSQDLSSTLSAVAPVLARVSGGGGGAPGGANTDIQFNDGGAFGGDPNFTWNKTTGSFNADGGATSVTSILVGAHQALGFTLDATSPELDITNFEPLGVLSLTAAAEIDVIADTTNPLASVGIESGGSVSIEAFKGAILIELDSANTNNIQMGIAGGPGGNPTVIQIGDAGGGVAGIGFFNTAPIVKPNVTGSRGGNAALASFLTAMADLGLITDSTTA